MEFEQLCENLKDVGDELCMKSAQQVLRVENEPITSWVRIICAGPKRARSKAGSAVGVPSQTNLASIFSSPHALRRRVSPYQCRDAFEAILGEFRVTRILADLAKDIDQPTEDGLMHGSKALPCGDDHSHSACDSSASQHLHHIRLHFMR